MTHLQFSFTSVFALKIALHASFWKYTELPQSYENFIHLSLPAYISSFIKTIIQ